MKTQFFEIYWLQDRVWGVPIDPRPFNQLRKDYDNCFNFPGQTACFFLVTRDNSIRREDALSFAATIAEGRFVHRRVDLSSLGTGYMRTKNEAI